jgi:hypothetical protein
MFAISVRIAAKRRTNHSPHRRCRRTRQLNWTRQWLGFSSNIEENPIVEIQKAATALGMAFNTVSAAVGRLCDVGILVQNP